jgi:hypothetical protein
MAAIWPESEDECSCIHSYGGGERTEVSASSLFVVSFATGVRKRAKTFCSIHSMVDD